MSDEFFRTTTRWYKYESAKRGECLLELDWNGAFRLYKDNRILDAGKWSHLLRVVWTLPPGKKFTTVDATIERIVK